MKGGARRIRKELRLLQPQLYRSDFLSACDVFISLKNIFFFNDMFNYLLPSA